MAKGIKKSVRKKKRVGKKLVAKTRRKKAVAPVAKQKAKKKNGAPKALKQPTATPAMRGIAAAATLGCCTLRGSGPDQQIPGITREQCRLESIRLGKNFSWVAGSCA